MPIKSWDQDLRIPRFGMIRLGEKGPKGNPIALDYFVVPHEVKAVYGEQPKELDILLPSEDLDQVLTAWYKRYGKTSGLICRGDEQTALVPTLHIIGHPEDYPVRMGNDGHFYDAEDRELPVERLGGSRWVRIPCDPTTCRFAAKADDRPPSCRPIAILNFLLPEVPGAIGVYSIATSSKKSYQNLLAGIMLIRNRLGYISDIPLKLRVSMVEFHPVVNGQKITTKKPILDIRLAVSLKEALELSKERRLQLTNRVHLPFEPVDESVAPETFYVFPDDEDQGASRKGTGHTDVPQDVLDDPDDPLRPGGEELVLPADYDDGGYEQAAAYAVDATPESSGQPEKPEEPQQPQPQPQPEQKQSPKPKDDNGKPASEPQLKFIKSLAAKKLDPEKPDTWPHGYKALIEGGSLTSVQATALINQLKAMPNFIPANAAPAKTENKPEQKPEQETQPKVENGAAPVSPGFQVAEGQPITFLVVGQPKAFTSMSGLAIMAKAKVDGADGIWEISWNSTETTQVRPNGYKYEAVVIKAKTDARKAFVKDLKVQQTQ